MASGGLRVERHGATAVLTLDTPPANALTAPVRRALLTTLREGLEGCQSVVLAGHGRSFSSALPLEPDPESPDLAEVCSAVAALELPVVAALYGLVMGPGAELALAAHARVADLDTRIALPFVALGLCPAGGTTLRLPKLVGPSPALTLLITGRAVSMKEALSIGLLDRLHDSPGEGSEREGLLAAALRLADEMAAGRRFARPQPDPRDWHRAITAARRDHSGALPAVGRIIDCVEAAHLLPPEAALAFEAVALEDLEKSSEVSALRAAALAERKAAVLPPDVARLRPARVARTGLSGATPALVTLALAALRRGVAVAWAFPTPEVRDETLSLVDGGFAQMQRAGQITPLKRAEDRARLTEVARSDLAGLDLLVHATPPLLPTAGAQLVLDGAAGEVGLAIAPSGRASELACPLDAPPGAIATAIATLRHIGLPPVLVGDRPVLGTRIMQAGDRALARLAALGVPARSLSTALETIGVHAPPLASALALSPAQDMSAEEVQKRWFGALANEGLRLLEAGIARRPSDIDHALIAGHAFPRWQGGPMHQASQRGLLVLRHDLRRWAEDDPLWEPAPLIDQLIADGRQLTSLDG